MYSVCCAGFTPLHKAVQENKLECLSALIKAGADVNKGDGTSGRTALHHAVLQDNVVLVMELLINVSVYLCIKMCILTLVSVQTFLLQTGFKSDTGIYSVRKKLGN